MVLFNWDKILRVTKGNSRYALYVLIMLAYKSVPKNKADPIYKYSGISFKGESFLVHPKRFIDSSYDYYQWEKTQYIDLASKRPLSNYIAFKETRLPLLFVEDSDLDNIKRNRLLQIENDMIIFKYEEALKRK